MKYAICINNKDFEASLESRKIYKIDESEPIDNDFISIFDETGESYFYPKERFEKIELPSKIENKMNFELA
jgi:hypothetical protein